MRRLAPFLLPLAACATQSFQPRFKPPAPPQPSVVMSELIAPRVRKERPVAVGLTTDPMRLFAWDLKGGLLWEKSVDAKSAPLVAADSVVLQESQGVVVRDLESGEVRALLDEQAALIGADGEGDRLVVSMARALPNHPGKIALLEGGKVRWRQELSLPVGVPAVVGKYVVVPWATQRLSVLSVEDGRELGRYPYVNTVMGKALVEDGRLYVGQLGLLPVDAQLLEEPSRKRAPYTPFLRQLPAQPPLLADGYVPVADPDNASHRLQLNWQIEARAGAPSSANDLLMLRFYRLLFALEANSDAIRWVRSFDHDLVGAAVQAGGVWLADSAGQVSWLDPAGATHFSVSLDKPVRVITLRPGSYLPPSAAASSAPIGNLREQLFAAASLDDDRLAAGRAYAAQSLSRFPEADATANLVDLCAEAKFPEPLRAAACAELIGRKNGEASVLAALRVRASFLEGTPAPPVGPLAQAAAKMQIKQAGTLLVSHIDDPNTSTRDLVALFQSIEALADRGSAPSVERFVRLHHAEPEGSDLAQPLAAALHALGMLRGARERATLVDVAADPLTPKSTRDQAQAALAISDAPPPPKAAGEKVEAPSEAPPQDEVQTDPRAYALTPELVRKTLWPLRDRLGRCLAADPSHPRSGRTSLVIDGQGRVEGVFVLPVSLQGCVEPLLRQTRFPSTRLGRQRLTHVFYGASAASHSEKSNRRQRP